LGTQPKMQDLKMKNLNFGFYYIMYCCLLQP